MRAFVTGASGFIGRHLVEKLLQTGWTVKALIHNRTLPLETRGLEYVRGDIERETAWKEALEGTDVLFHLAAALGGSPLNKKEFQRTNAEGTRKVLQAAQKAGIKKTVHFSSAGVLGAVKPGDKAGELYPLHPLSVYDQTKLEGEQIALQMAQEGLSLVVIRPGWVYGPGDTRTFKLIKVIAKKRFILVTRGTTWQTPVHIEDLLDGVCLCLERGKPGEVYHLAGNEVLTVRQIVDSIAEATGSFIPRLSLPLFPVKLAAWKLETAFKLVGKEAPLTRGKLAFFIHPKPLSIDKAARELGYTPPTGFKTGIAETVRWYRENGWL
jgi:nucleoside-diphosphate-sugar epimerase